MTEAITNEQLRNFVHTSVSDDFGLTVAQVAEKAKYYGRFYNWLGMDVARVTEVLEIVKARGVSPAFFAAYEKTEGYNSSWGWLNHTYVNGTPTTDAASVADWVVTQSNIMTGGPAWIDYANYKDFVPESVKTAGNADFQNMSAGSIGRVVIAGTAAAAWEVYYPNGLLAEYNGVQNYGAPITNMMESIIEWGGTIDGSGGGGGVDPRPTGTTGHLPNNPTPPQYKHEEGREEMIYTVKKGDTLSEIAKKHNVAMKDILGVHHLGDWNKLDIGQMLLIPTTKKTERKYHIVKSGDNIWKIAGQHGLRVTDVIKLNTQLNNPDIIKVGEKIWLT